MIELSGRTIEERIEVVVVHFTQFKEILASFWTCLYLEVDHYIPQRSLE